MLKPNGSLDFYVVRSTVVANNQSGSPSMTLAALPLAAQPVTKQSAIRTAKGRARSPTAKGPAAFGRAFEVVEQRGIEPLTSTLRTSRSPN
jgi:hypothetical protein